jgi:hypothetical protein
MNWSNVAQDRDKWPAVESRVINCEFPDNVVNFLTRREGIRFLKKALPHGVHYLVMCIGIKF